MALRTKWLLLAILLMLGPACDEEADDDDTSSDEGIQVQITINEVIPTHVTVHGTTDIDGVTAVAVEFGLDASLGDEVAAEWDGDGAFSGVVQLLKAGTEYHYQVRLETDEGAIHTEPATFTTGPTPTGMPELAVYSPLVDQVTDGYVITSLITFPPAVVILDREGDFVWWTIPDTEDYASIVRAHVSRDRQWVIYLMSLGEFSSGGDDDDDDDTSLVGEDYLVRVKLDGSEVESTHVSHCHHDFLELPDGSFALLQSEHRTIGENEVFGDAVVELDADGNMTTIWSAFDHLEYDPEYEDHGWVHANAIDYIEDEDAYIVSLRSYDALHKIDRASGEEIWRLGGPFSDFQTATAETELFGCQHQFDTVEGGIIVHDNRDDVALPSRVIEYAMDTDAMQVDYVWQYVVDPPMHVIGLGDVSRLPTGNTFVVWSSQGQMDEVTPDGEVAWRLNMPLGGALGYGSWMESVIE
jgi:hypothetical protein